MAATSTTLAAACGASDQTITVTSATGFAVGNLIRVDSEWMLQTAAAVNTTTIPVRRNGMNGSAVVAHTILAPVMTCLPSDTLNAGPDQILNPAVANKQITSYGASGAITPPTFDTLVLLNKATAAAMTLAGPSALADGTEVTILSTTAAAHTVTYTAGFYGDTDSSDVATFAAKAGASMTILAIKGTWGVKSLANVTLA